MCIRHTVSQTTNKNICGVSQELLSNEQHETGFSSVLIHITSEYNSSTAQTSFFKTILFILCSRHYTITSLQTAFVFISIKHSDLTESHHMSCLKSNSCGLKKRCSAECLLLFTVHTIKVNRGFCTRKLKEP